MRIGTDKSAGVHECVRSNRYDLLGMSLDENRAFLEVTPTGPAKSTFGSSLILADFPTTELGDAVNFRIAYHSFRITKLAGLSAAKYRSDLRSNAVPFSVGPGPGPRQRRAGRHSSRCSRQGTRPRLLPA